MPTFIRPTLTKFNMQSMLRCAVDKCEIGHATAPATGAALPTMGGVVQEYVSLDREGATVVCAGVAKYVGDSVMILLEDTIQAEANAAWITKAPAILVALKAGAVVAENADVFFDDAAGTFTSVASGNIWCGKFNSAALELNPPGLPAGNYAEINFSNGYNS